MSFSIDPFRHLYDFDSHFLTLTNHRYHYLDEGEGEPIVMLHGNPTWSFMYRELVKSLRDSYRAIVPDHIGCGLSDKPDSSQYEYTLSRRVSDLECLLESISATRNLTLVLHDWGGLIGMAFAARHPSAVRRFVIFNTAGFRLPAGKSLHWTLRFCKHSGSAAYLIRRFNAFAVIVSLLGCRRKKMSKEIKKAYLDPYDSWENRIAILRFVQDIPLTPQDPSYSLLYKTERHLDCFRDRPLLICWGEKDFIFDGDFLNEWICRFPQAEVHRFSRAGHNVVEDVADQITPLVRRFLLNHPISSVTP